MYRLEMAADPSHPRNTLQRQHWSVHLSKPKIQFVHNSSICIGEPQNFSSPIIAHIKQLNILMAKIMQDWCVYILQSPWDSRPILWLKNFILGGVIIAYHFTLSSIYM